MSWTRAACPLRASLVLVAAMVLAGLSSSPQAQPRAKGQPPIEDIDTERIFLPNGIEVLLMPDPASRVVTVISVIGAGSSYENARLSGASHFLEHMLFNGTERRTQKQLYNAEDAAGGFNNAFTRRTHAAFMMTMPGPELELALDLQSDMLFHSRLPATKFEKERGIILEEFAMGQDTGGATLDEVLQRETYPASAYGLPILGSEASIRRLGRHEVLDYYERLYVPENMRVVLLGGFEPEAAREHLESTFGRERPSGVRPALPPAPPPIESTRLISHDLDVSTGHLRLLFNAPPLSRPETLALEAALSLLTSGANSALYQAMDKSLPGMILSCGGGLTGGPHFGRAQIDISFAADAAPDEVWRVAREALAGLARPKGERLENWKTSERAAQIFARQRSYMYAPLYSEEVALRGLWGLESRLDRIVDLSIEEVRAAAEGLFAGPHWAILVSPSRPSPASGMAMGDLPPAMEGMKGMPPAMMKAMARQRAGDQDVDREAEEGADQAPGAGAPGSARPAPAAAFAEVPLQVEEATLPGGARLLTLGAPADGSLSIYVLIEGRNFLEPEGQEGVTELLHQVMSAGPEGLTEAEFQDELAALGAEMQAADRGFIPFDDYYTQREFSFVRFQCLDEYAAEAFILLGRMLREPALDPVVIERERTRLRDRLMNEAASARARGTAYLRELLYGEGHPLARSPYGDPGSVTELDGEALRAYHQRLLDPRRVWIGVVSGHPRERLLAWAAELIPPPSGSGAPGPHLGMTPQRFEQWQARGEIEQHVANRLRAAAAQPGAHGLHAYEAGGEVTRLVLAADLATGAEGRTYVLETLLIDPAAGAARGTPAWTRRSGALEVATGVLSSRLSFHLREERGMAYGIGASLSELGDAWLYRAGAETRAENTDEMAAGLVQLRREAAAAAPAGHEAGSREAGGRPAGAPEAEFDRIAQKQFGRTLRRQEMRLNQAMYTVWAARKGKPPLAWWTEAEALPEVSDEDVREALRMLAEAEPTILLMAR